MTERIAIESFVRQVNDLAPLPAVALKVLQLAENDDVSAHDLASAIATDQAMTATVLKLANSAYYAAGREITTVRDAVVLLGMVEVRRLALTTALMGRFVDSGALSIVSFWGHALAVGMVAEVMARNTRLAPPEEAYTAGILHDIGKLIMNQYAQEHFDAAASLATNKGLPLERAEAEVFGFSHAQLGGRLAEVWRLPAALAEAIAEHHASPGPDRGLCYVVAQANDLCRDHGLWCGFDDIEPGAAAPTHSGADPLRATALDKLGGIEQIVERANKFLGASLTTDTRRPAAIVVPTSPRFVAPSGSGSRPGAGAATAATRAQRPAPPAWEPASPNSDASPRRSPWAAPDRFPDRFGRP